jgi:hypothetical protein
VQGSQLADGLYWVPCDVVLNGSNLTGTFTIISTGKVEVSGSVQSEFNSFTNGILFWTNSDQSDAIKLSGSNSSMKGAILAPNGLVEASGSDLVLSCGLAGKYLKLNGSGLQVDQAECQLFQPAHGACELYPYTIEQSVIDGMQVGETMNQYATSVGQGNYSLLSWTGANDSNTLAASFTQPGDSGNYVNPDDAQDDLLTVGDWVQGAPGKMNANHVRNAIDDLIGVPIVVPLWSDTRKQGSQFDYHVTGFATIELTDYKLNGNSYISFEYLGTPNCANVLAAKTEPTQKLWVGSVDPGLNHAGMGAGPAPAPYMPFGHHLLSNRLTLPGLQTWRLMFEGH